MRRYFDLQCTSIMATTIAIGPFRTSLVDQPTTAPAGREISHLHARRLEVIMPERCMPSLPSIYQALRLYYRGWSPPSLPSQYKASTSSTCLAESDLSGAIATDDVHHRLFQAPSSRDCCKHITHHHQTSMASTLADVELSSLHCILER